VGSTVTWNVVPQNPGTLRWVDDLLGHEWAERIEFHEEHHDDVEPPGVTGEVVSIQVATCRLEPKEGGPGMVFVPVPSSGRLRRVEVADPWEPEPPEDRMGLESFNGWIVEVELAQP